MSFTPSLRSVTTISLSSTSPDSVSSASQSTVLYFTYLTSLQSTSHSNAAPEIWTNLPKGEWAAIPFVNDLQSRSLWTASISVDNATATKIDGLERTEYTYAFTYRLRHQDGHIEWLAGEDCNGHICIVTARDDDVDDVDTRFMAESADALTNGAKFTISHKSKNSALIEFEVKEGGKSGDIESFDLATVLKLRGIDCEGFTLERSKRPWFLARQLYFPNAIKDVSPHFDNQLIVLQNIQTSSTSSSMSLKPRIIVLYPFSTPDVSSTLRGGEESLWLRSTRDSDRSSVEVKAKIAIAYSRIGSEHNENLKKLIQDCVDIASQAIQPEMPENGKDSYADETLTGAGNQTEEAQLPLQGLTWCTWNALGQDYKISQVISSLEKLLSSSTVDQSKGSGHGTKNLFVEAVDTVMLDDGWQDVIEYQDPNGTGRRGLNSFCCRPAWYDLAGKGETNVERNKQLEVAVSKIKACCGGRINKVGVWMTLAGYWDAIAPESSLSKEFDLHTWEVRSDDYSDANTLFRLPKLEHIQKYYESYFTTLAKAGVDFVKVDDQGHCDFLAPCSTQDAGATRLEMLRAFKAAADLVFGEEGKIKFVHCMAGSPRIWAGQLGLIHGRGKSIIRNSDDYFPNEPDSHRWHVHANAFNSLLTRSLQFVPDFDMCQEGHPFGSYHISLRGLAPAPTYTTDVAGELTGSPSGWNALLARTKGDGIRDRSVKVVQTRSDTGTVLAGRIAEDVMAGGEGPALKMGLAFPQANGAVLGVWNCRWQEQDAHVVIDARDISDAFGGSDQGVLSSKSGVILYIGKGGVVKVSQSSIEQSLRTCNRLAMVPLAGLVLPARCSGMMTIVSPFELACSQQVVVSSSRPSVAIACLGLLDKHVSLAAIKSVKVVQSSSTLLPQSSTRAVESAKKVYSSEAGSCSSLYKGGPMTSHQQRLFFPPPPTPPDSRLTYLLLCLTGYRSSLQTSKQEKTQSESENRTVRSEFTRLGRDVMRNPFWTLWNEARAMITFGFAIAVWAVARAVHHRPRINDHSWARREILDEEETEKKDVLTTHSNDTGTRGGRITEMTKSSGLPELSSAVCIDMKGATGYGNTPTSTSLQIELLFISDRFAFHVDRISSDVTLPVTFSMTLDGEKVSEDYITRSSDDLRSADSEPLGGRGGGELIEVELERFWDDKGKLGNRESPTRRSSRDYWTVLVSC